MTIFRKIFSFVFILDPGYRNYFMLDPPKYKNYQKSRSNSSPENKKIRSELDELKDERDRLTIKRDAEKRAEEYDAESRELEKEFQRKSQKAKCGATPAVDLSDPEALANHLASLQAELKQATDGKPQPVRPPHECFKYKGLIIPIYKDIRNTPLWYNYKKILIEERGNKCEKWDPEICSQYRLELHHKKLINEGGTNRPSNLVLLCKGHHAAIHEWMIKKRRYEQERKNRQEKKRKQEEEQRKLREDKAGKKNLYIFSKKSLCETLDIPGNSTKSEISSYRKRALKRYHPDVGGNGAMFDIVNKSYKELLKLCDKIDQLSYTDHPQTHEIKHWA